MTITTRKHGKRLGLLLAFCAGPLAAQNLSLPQTATRTYSTVQEPGTYALPTGPVRSGTLPTTRIEGRIEIESWRIPQSGASSFQLIEPLRDALIADGYDITLDCATQRCGGFDFRFATLVLPAPEMFVSLDDFHFVAAQKPGAGAISLLASKGPRDGYVQIIRAGDAVQAETITDAAPIRSVATGDLAQTLEADGHVILPDVIFDTGSTTLGAGAIASLDALADYLAANPSRRLLIVGHTDATGSLDANRAISLRRAGSAVSYLRERHGTPTAQLSAEGAGYLSPVASNLTEEGREANRRIEAVLLSTD